MSSASTSEAQEPATDLRTVPEEVAGVLEFPATYAQQGLWFFYCLSPESAFYNVSMVHRLTGELDTAVLRSALNDVVRRHEALRTTFREYDGELRQVVADAVDIELAVHEAAGSGDDGTAPHEVPAVREQLTGLIQAPFDLESGPLLRAALVRIAPGDHLLVLSMHHIVVDGWSLGIFLRELAETYRARRAGESPQLPELSIQYGDYAEWLIEQLRGQALEDGLDYWRTQLGGELPELRLATDRPRPETRSFGGDRFDFTFDEEITGRLKEMCRAQGVTLYMALFAGVSTMLHHYSGQDDFVLGTPMAGRGDAQTQPLIGSFVNTLPMRADLSGNPSFTGLLGRVREMSQGAYAHDDIPFEKIVEDVAPQRGIGANPLFQVTFALQNYELGGFDLEGVHTERIAVEEGTARFDLEVHCWDDPHRLRGSFVYSTDLFDRVTMERMAAHLTRVIEEALADPSRRVGELSLLTDDDRRVLDAVGSPGDAPRSDATVPGLFAGQVAARPGATAVRAPGAVLSYAELATRASTVAARLRAAGLTPGTRVGVHPAGPVDELVGTLAVLEAGGVHVPLNPSDDPALLRRSILRTRPGLLLTSGAAGDWAEGLTAVDLGATDPGATDPGTTEAPASPAGSDPALLLDVPGGPLVLDHAGLADRLARLAGLSALTADDVVARHAPWGQERAVWEALLPVCHGASLAAADGRVTPEGTTVVIAADSDLTGLLAADAPAPSPRVLLCLPSTASPALAHRCHDRFGTVARWVYATPQAGPTGIADPVPADTALLFTPLRPIRMLDAHGAPVPVGVPAEVHTAGPGLARRAAGNGPVTWAACGDTGRITADGRLELLGRLQGTAVVAGLPVDVAEVTAAILADSGIVGCAVVERRSTAGHTELVAYVVRSGQVTSQSVAQAARAALPGGTALAAVVFVTALPRTPGGRVDTAALSELPVLDDELAGAWEQALAARGVPAAVVVAERDPAPTADDFVNLRTLPRDRTVEETRTAGGGAGHPDVPAISSGGPALDPGAANLAEVLRRAAADPASGDLVYVAADGTEHHQSYARLREEASRVLGGLRALGARPGDKVVLQLADNRDFVAGLWACVLGGFVSVPLAVSPTYAEDTAATNKLAGAWALLSGPLLLTDRSLAGPLRGLGSRLGWNDLRLAVLDDLREAPEATDWHDSRGDDLVLLLLTSGSTGCPKAVELRHDNVLTRSAAARHVYELTPQDVSFNWMPLDHVGGIVMSHIRDVFVGCRQIQAPTQWVLAEPLRWIAKMAEHRVTTTWAPNFAFGLIADRADPHAGQDGDLSSLRVIINGGEAIVPRVARRFMKALAPLGLPSTAMRPAWGMSETSSGEVDDRFDPEATGDDQFVCVGAPFPGFTMRIVDGDDAVVREGMPGRLQVKGPAVTSGYHLNPEQNASSFTEDGWFETGDLAVLRDGKLTITGRAKDSIIINGHNFHSHELEECVEELDQVERSFTAACAVRTAESSTDELALFFSLADGVAETEVIPLVRAKLLRETGAHASYLVPVTRDRIPKTEIGKIQRTLLRERFEAGEFAAEQRRTGAGTQDDATLPNWFHRPVWQRAAAGPRAVTPDVGHTLLVADRHGLADALAGMLRDRGERCTVLPVGTAHAPAAQSRYDTTDTVDRVVHLAGCAPYQELPTGTEELSAAYREGPLALAELVGCLVRANPGGRPLALTVVATHSQWVREGDRLVPERAASAGVVKSAGQEYDWLRATHLDVEPQDHSESAHRILEILDAAADDPEQALRDAERWVRRIERLPAAPAATTGLRRDELVVVSGGLGGLAAETAAHLLSAYGVRLLLLGRTPLPAEEVWDETLASGGTTAERIAVLRRLRALGEVRYAAADVTDEAAVRAAFQHAEEHFAASATTVFHLAGHFHEAPVTEAGEDDWAEVTRAKVLGAAVLHHLVKDRPGARFLSYSSVNGFFGGANVAGYAAANAFLDALAVHQSTAHGMRAQSLGWTMWDEVGLSRGYALKALTEARGYRVLAPEQGVASLDVALRHATPQVLIGVDHTAPWPAGRLLTPAAALHRLVGYRTDGSAGEGRGAFALPDRYGTLTNCEFTAVTELPLTESGEIDRRRLAGAGGAGATAAMAAAADDRPSSAAEQVIAAIWCDLLGLGEVGVHDNFFDIGGHSLRAAMLLSRLRAELGVDLTIASLFENPTIAGLARQLDPMTAQDPLAVVLPLRGEGAAAPLFCLHPGGGISWCYSGLLGGLPDRHPVYGIQARGLNGEEPLPKTLDEMVDDYLAQVREIRPAGPYHFLGWSFGGVIAHAMAARLTAEGHQVGVLAMIDAWPADPELDPEFGDDLNVEKEMLGALLADAGYEGPVQEELTRTEALRILRDEGSPLGSLTEESITSLVAIAANNIKLRARELTPYEGDLLLFHAAGDDRDVDAVTRSWRRFSTGRIEDRLMPYGHNSIIHPKPLAEIGAAVGERMAEA